MSEAMVAQKGPFAYEVQAGKSYAWCACGRSNNQPFCDGSHQGTGLAPKLFKPEEDGTVYLCGCKQTGSSPMCDGTHASL